MSDFAPLASPSMSTSTSDTKKARRFFNFPSSLLPPLPSMPDIPRLRASQSASAVPTLASPQPTLASPSPSSRPKGHYRTHSSLAGSPPPLSTSGNSSGPNSLGGGAQVVRTTSEARRGIMKVKHASPPYMPTLAQSAELPMMEECDRRTSIPVPRGFDQTSALHSAPPHKPLIKATSMADLSRKEKDQSLKHARKSFITAESPLPLGSSGWGQSYSAAPLSSSTMPSTPMTARTPVSALPPTAATAPFHATLIDMSQRPAPTAEDLTLVSISFGFSLAEERNCSTLTLPLETLRPAGGLLLNFIEGHLAKVTRKAPFGGKDLRIVSETEERQPSMTDGESAESSDVETDEYGPEAILRDEYVKSLWLPSPTGLEPQVSNTSTTPRSAPARTSAYYTPPKRRAHVRNQFSQQDPYPTPSSPLLPRSAPLLSQRRRATYLCLPDIEERGTVTEVKVLLLRDAASWHIIASRLATGSWPPEVVSSTSVRQATLNVMEELRWAGMPRSIQEMFPAHSQMQVPPPPLTPARAYMEKYTTQESLPPIPVPKLQRWDWEGKRHRRLSSRSVKLGDSAAMRGGAGYV